MKADVRYSREVGTRICELIADNYRLTQIAAMEDMPSRQSIWNWLAEHEDFRLMYEKARDELYSHMADELLEIADDAKNDWVEREYGKEFDKEHAMRSRLRVDTRKWLMSKILPKKFGDKLEVEHDVSEGFADKLVRARERALVPSAITIDNE